jgi:hypothetical protein
MIVLIENILEYVPTILLQSDQNQKQSELSKITHSQILS